VDAVVAVIRAVVTAHIHHILGVVRRPARIDARLDELHVMMYQKKKAMNVLNIAAV
jgi:hypothetical protein